MLLFEERKWSKPQKCSVKTKEEFGDIQMKKGNNRPETLFPFHSGMYSISHWMSLVERKVQWRCSKSEVLLPSMANLWTSLPKKVTESTALTG